MQPARSWKDGPDASRAAVTLHEIYDCALRFAHDKNLPPDAPRPQRRAATRALQRTRHRVEHHLPWLGEELDEFLRQRLGEFRRVAQHIFLARRWLWNEPRLLEFQPFLGGEVVEAVGFVIMKYCITAYQP